jgi:branched-chain amino acid aminotransferase
MTVIAAKSETWTYVDGDWHAGNVAIAGPMTHAFWMGSSVFDGARAFDGVCPDAELHFARVNASAEAMGLKPYLSVDDMNGLLADGLKKFETKEAIYIRPMYWADAGGYMGVTSDPDSTRFLLCLYEAPMIAASGFSVSVSPFRRPTYETMPTNAKAGCLYPNNARAIMEAKSRGFDNCLVRDMHGNIAETGTSNVFLVRDGVVMTPVPNGCFLSGITRSRVIGLLRAAGHEVVETTLRSGDFLAADEVFSTGNHSKVVPITRVEEREMQAGPIGRKARELYMDWARS